MVFSSFIFLFYFLPIVVIGYYLLNKKLKNVFLLLSSIFFYIWGAPNFIGILITTTVIDYYLVKLIHQTPHKQIKRIALSVSLIISIGILSYFKYANFFVESLNSILNHAGIDKVGWTSVALPIGISFFTFQKITYGIDVYRGVHKPLKRVWDYLLYIIMFPQLVAGPIIRFNTIADQIENRDENIDNVYLGLIRFIID